MARPIFADDDYSRPSDAIYEPWTWLHIFGEVLQPILVYPQHPSDAADMKTLISAVILGTAWCLLR
jgi:hypothetical protein